MKSELPAGFYLPREGGEGAREHFESTSATAGPWSRKAQHGGPPAALLGRALERLEPQLDRVLGRFSMDLLGPVPVGPVSVEARVLRPGRSVSLREAVLYDDVAGRPVAIGRAWALPRAEPLPHRLPGLTHGPDQAGRSSHRRPGHGAISTRSSGAGSPGRSASPGPRWCGCVRGSRCCPARR
uniref:acyl-CoA thioesterase domain-containing protein n=1 Tax=Nocardioides terrisoli TaxID=3388267 RepID=UPI0037C62A9D